MSGGHKKLDLLLGVEPATSPQVDPSPTPPGSASPAPTSLHSDNRQARAELARQRDLSHLTGNSIGSLVQALEGPLTEFSVWHQSETLRREQAFIRLEIAQEGAWLPEEIAVTGSVRIRDWQPRPEFLQEIRQATIRLIAEAEGEVSRRYLAFAEESAVDLESNIDSVAGFLRSEGYLWATMEQLGGPEGLRDVLTRFGDRFFPMHASNPIESPLWAESLGTRIQIPPTIYPGDDPFRRNITLALTFRLRFVLEQPFSRVRVSLFRDAP